MKIPPARFSTKTVLCRLSLTFCATSRAMTSVAPPAASPTMILIGLAEGACASARDAPISSVAPASRNATGRSSVIIPSSSHSRCALVQQRRHDALARQRQVAQAHAECTRDRIADGRRRRAHGDLAEPERRLVWRLDEAQLDLRRLGEAQDRVALPCRGRNLAVHKPHLLLQGPTRRLDDAALHLVGGAVRIDDKTGVHAGPDARQPAASTST